MLFKCILRWLRNYASDPYSLFGEAVDQLTLVIIGVVYGTVSALSAGDFVARRGQGHQGTSWGGAGATR